MVYVDLEEKGHDMYCSRDKIYAPELAGLLLYKTFKIRY